MTIQALTRRASHVLWIGDIGSMALALAGALIYVDPARPEDVREFLVMRIELMTILLLLAFTTCWHLIFRAHGLYRLRTLEPGAAWWEVTRAVVTGNGLLWVTLPFAGLDDSVTVFLAVLFAGTFVGAQLLHGGTRLLVKHGERPRGSLKKVAIVGCGPRGAALGKKIWEHPGLGYLLVGYVDDMGTPDSPLHGGPEKLLGPVEQIASIIISEGLDEVFIALPVKSHYDQIAMVMALCEESGVVVRMPADVFEARIAKARVDYLDDATLLTFETPRPASMARVWKRAFDIAASCVVLVMLTPVFALVAVAIKIWSPGPVFFLQERVGLGGKKFRIVKFRTMVHNAEAAQAALEATNEVRGPAFKMAADPRVTSLGRVLRKFSIDELPQFVNVLVGHMSLVGPRPLPGRDVERFNDHWLNRRFSVKPGLTCLWQANGRHELSFRHWMELDLQYIDHWSLRLDWEIIAKTIPAVLRGGGAS